MKKIISTLLCFSVLMFTAWSCNDNSKTTPNDDKVEVTHKYKIHMGGVNEMNLAPDKAPALSTLEDYADLTYKAISSKCKKEPWTITATAATKEAASAEADRQAIEVFNSMITKIDQSIAEFKVAFDTKRGELASDIFSYSSKYYFRIANMTPTLDKQFSVPSNDYYEAIKEGSTKVTVEAIGGTQY